MDALTSILMHVRICTSMIRLCIQAVELGSDGHITEACYMHFMLGQTLKVSHKLMKTTI